ncbi:SDR family NAD(P)-dependent oxidoreductase [Nocardia sp. CA-128927]|uniref:SDR family NAD(P)-dependent oxidoreductase n=1 Tax=Nocardia sp. CA-128927 TaxID=3239975 RepID=UPI003D964B1B
MRTILQKSRGSSVSCVGPGLGMSMAKRFGSEGFRVALVSRSDARHEGYLKELAAQGIDATAYAADVTDRARLKSVLAEIAGDSDIEVAYYGPGPTQQPIPLTEIDSTTAQSAFDWVWPAVDMVHEVLPAMLDRGTGALLFAGGLSSVRPMPMLGHLALPSAALRNYAVTLNAALADRGVYAATLTIGRLIERGDIHAMVTADPGRFGSLEGRTLDPDDLAATAWEMYRARDRAEAVFDLFSG